MRTHVCVMTDDNVDCNNNMNNQISVYRSLST